MRTTVDIKDEHRSKLLELAARRGEKGFSRILGEALDLFFEQEGDRRDRVRRAKAALGSFDQAEAEALRAEAQRLRNSWR